MSTDALAIAQAMESEYCTLIDQTTRVLGAGYGERRAAERKMREFVARYSGATWRLMSASGDPQSLGYRIIELVGSYGDRASAADIRKLLVDLSDDYGRFLVDEALREYMRREEEMRDWPSSGLTLELAQEAKRTSKKHFAWPFTFVHRLDVTPHEIPENAAEDLNVARARQAVRTRLRRMMATLLRREEQRGGVRCLLATRGQWEPAVLDLVRRDLGVGVSKYGDELLECLLGEILDAARCHGESIAGEKWGAIIVESDQTLLVASCVSK